MLKLIHVATNTEFELPRNTRIPFLLFSPIFEEQGSTTYSATMSGRSAINRRLTGYQHRPGRQNNSGTLIPVWLEVSGQRKRCTLNIIEADADEIKYNLLIDEGSFIVEHGEKKLNDLQTLVDLGTLMPIPFTSDNEHHAKTYPEVNFAWPIIKNANFFDGTAYQDGYQANCNYVNYPDDYVTVPSDDYYAKSPQPFLVYVVERMFELLGYKVTENFLNQPGLNQLLILNMVDIIIVNVHWENGELLNVTQSRILYYEKNHMPTKSIKSFLNSLLGRFNLHTIIDESNKTVKIVNFDSILLNPANNDISKYCSSIKLKKVPDVTGIEFNMSGEIPTNLLEMIVNPEDISGKLILPEINPADKDNGIYKLNAYYRVNNDGEFGDAYYQIIRNELGVVEWAFKGWANLGNIIVGDSEKLKKIETDFTYAFNYGALYINGGIEGLVQIYDKQGSSELIEFNPEDDYGMVLAFYEPTSATQDYPKTKWFYNENGVDITLIPGAENGPINTFFKHTIDFYLNRGRVYETLIQLPLSKLFSLDWAQKVTIHGGKFLIKNIKGEFTMNGVTYDSAEVVEC